MVVDIGGGTVDIAVHDKSDGRIRELLPPIGNNWGGTTVNEAFSRLLQEIVEDKGFEAFIESDASAQATLNKLFYEEFEERKKRFGNATDKSIDKIVVTLPHAMMQFYCNDKLQKAEKFNIDYNPKKCSLSISFKVLEEKVFKSTIDKITECVGAAFDKLKRDKIDTVYLVGGCGGCSFVSQRIEKAIAQHCDILYDNTECPIQPDLAVVSGAVMWRKHPNIIQSRVADATYGTNVAPVFDPSIHDEHYKYEDEDGEQHCDNVFEVFVLKGEEIKDEVYKATFIPGSQRQTQTNISIYCTADDGVQYVEDKKGKRTVRVIGELILDIPNPDNIPRKERQYDVFMDFRGTEIQARAQYSITGEEVKTVCDFLSKQD